MTGGIVNRGLMTVTLAAAVSLGNGCASIISTTSQKLTITSDPSPAKVTINGEAKGETPLTVKVKRRDMQEISVTRAGYDPYEIVLDQNLNWLIWGNVVFFPGAMVDLLTAAAVKHEPSKIAAKLDKAGTAARSPVRPTFIKEVPKDKALVVFYRKKKMGGAAVACGISAGGKQLGSLRGNRCFVEEMAPGKHVFEATFGAYGAKKEVTFQAGKVYYIRAELGGVLIVMPDKQAAAELQRFRPAGRR